METFVSDLREFVDALYKIQSDHSWRPIEDFYNLNTEPLKKAVYMMLEKHEEFVEYISSNGREEDIEELNASLREKAPRMFFITMACFLNSLNDMEKEGIPISHDLVRWYREQGWKFPEFQFEKIGIERLNDKDNHTVDGNVTSEEGGRDTFHSREPAILDA